ncbi:MAG: prolyl oligopeptidase family serine peptidase [Burkholderiaceae bacterium]
MVSGAGLPGTMGTASTIALRALLVVALALALAGCATAPTHPTLVAAQAEGTRAPLLPMRRFVANIGWVGGFALSPDGSKLLNAETVGLDTGMAVRDAATGAPIVRYATGNQGRSGGLRQWLGDSRHLVYSLDPSGDENVQLFVQDTTDPALRPWAVTPWPGARSSVAARLPDGARMLFVSNRRDRAVFDLYEADPVSRTVVERARADTRIRGWLIDEAGTLLGRIRRTADDDGADRVFELSRPDGSWQTLRTVGGFDTWIVLRLDARSGRGWVLSNVDRDRVALIEIDLATGRETVLGGHDTVDIDTAFFAGRQGPPIAFQVEAGLPRLEMLDPAIASGLAAIADRALASGLIDERPVLVRPQSVADDGRRWIVRAVGRLAEVELLWDRDTGALRRLDAREPGDAARVLSPHEPFTFRASDGRTIHGLLTRPRGVSGPVPMVVAIHGGPWARDRWEAARFGPLQMLANRGYAVLQVDYRGSSGYGREHLWAGARVYGERLQDDIAEAVGWAVAAGLADRERIGLYGASFGGYSVLMQLIRKPHPYRCGVDVVGVADWARTIENWPRYWGARHWPERFYGRPEDPAERADMLRQSPVSALERIEAPLLVIHGDNDVRVMRQDSVDVVRSLRARGHPVTFVSFPDEGHSISKWRNRLAMWREVEDTFAACLGGASGGPDLYELMPTRMRRDAP